MKEARTKLENFVASHFKDELSNYFENECPQDHAIMMVKFLDMAAKNPILFVHLAVALMEEDKRPVNIQLNYADACKQEYIFISEDEFQLGPDGNTITNFVLDIEDEVWTDGIEYGHVEKEFANGN